MSRTVKKIWNIVSGVLVALVMLLALLLVGARLIGLQVFTVLSGSMEPTYHTGSLLYVRKVDSFAIEAGQPITFMLDETTVATHRVVEVVPDETDSTVVRFRTKGDANAVEDGNLVHYKNVIGVPIFSIPYLGYVADYIQHPPGSYLAIAVGALLLLFVFLPDVLSGETDKKKKGDRQTKKAAETPEHLSIVEQAQMVQTDEELCALIRRETEQLLTEDEVQTVFRQLKAGTFNEQTAEALRTKLHERKAAQ